MIQRYDSMRVFSGGKYQRTEMDKSCDGDYVLFADHEAEDSEWKKRVLEYAKTYGEEVEDLKQKLKIAVEALEYYSLFGKSTVEASEALRQIGDVK